MLSPSHTSQSYDSHTTSPARGRAPIFSSEFFVFTGVFLYYVIAFSGLCDNCWFVEILRAGALYIVVAGYIFILYFGLRQRTNSRGLFVDTLLWVASTLPLTAPLIKFAVPSNLQAIEAPGLKILYANVWTSNTEHQRFLALVGREEPDLIFVVEVDNIWVNAINSPLVSRGYSAIERPSEDNFGLALYSRCAFETQQGTSELLEKYALVGKAHCGEWPPFLLMGVHLLPTMGEDSWVINNATVGQLRSLQHQEQIPKLVIGDFNSTIHGLLYQRLADGLENLRNGFGFSRTWNMRSPLLRFTIDHALGTKGISVKNYRLGPDIGSDHLPLIIDFDVV